MRIVTCPKCNSTRCNEMPTLVGEVIKVLCRECGYYAKYKEFKIEGAEVTINSSLEEIITDLEVIRDYLEQLDNSLV